MYTACDGERGGSEDDFFEKGALVSNAQVSSIFALSLPSHASFRGLELPHLSSSFENRSSSRISLESCSTRHHQDQSSITEIIDMFAPTSRQWMSILRLTPFLLGMMLFSSLVDFILAVVYTAQLYNAPLDDDKLAHSQAKHWTIA